MSENNANELETDYKKIIEKISEEKEQRQKGLNEILRRKREIEKHQEFLSKDRVSPSGPVSRQLKSLSSERREYNNKVYQHLLSPKTKEKKSPKLTFNSRFDEESALKTMQASESQKNRLKMIDKRARYAGIVKEIFAPTVDPLKRLEVEKRINQQTIKTRSANNSRGNSVEKIFTKHDEFGANTHSNFKKSEGEWGAKIILNAGKITLETGNKFY